MEHDSSRVTTPNRRTVLQTIGAGGLALGGIAGTSGSAAAGSDENWTELSVGDHDQRYNVGYKNGDGAKTAKDVATTVYYDIDPLDALTIESDLDGLQTLEENDDIEYVEVDRQLEVELPPQEVEVQQETNGQTVPWGIERIGARDVHEMGITGDDVDVCVLDTGIDPSHEDLAANLGDGAAYTECQGDLVPWECEEPWSDDRESGHGTHVAGTVGALDNDLGVVGVGPDVTLHAVKVLDQNGVGFHSDIANGLAFAGFFEFDVANMSLGGVDTELKRAGVEYAHEQGVLLVASAQNEGAPVLYPAAYDEVIAVSATTPDDTLAWFSNRGPEVELAAPGVDVLSTVPQDGYAAYEGTSMAAPHVAGAGAIIMSLGYSASETREILNATAEDISLPSEHQGSGLVDVATAVELALEEQREKEEKKREKKGAAQ
ncbi:peptidase S8 and S53 subtilisin kexin sedolisin [Natrarchaeobius halalkaliphilus]|uniref:Peptidase S8 and S53 subtilisin kexin sedolisin n=1 Tax=Natrarchaeobius halalkaliphilus TaxID=1679091 RepID=A0A3N6MUA6_9EURY|nr:S8 family peptidase [Natrarchaeobius halalkaliphilus]RQG88972.1 peptidase S8 and S53 subtilisin kexin sedolisin [Natrarchaeobius halalkaliphilus]